MRTVCTLILLMAAPALGQDSTSAVYHDNVVMVVDASGSMGYDWSGTNNAKMPIAKKAMKTVMGTVSENTQIGIVVFGRVSDAWVYPLGPKNNEALERAIDSIGTGGGTPLGTYIKKGGDALVQQRQKQFGYGSYRLLIVTDGAASGGGEERMMKDYTAEIISRGINVDVIGVDMGAEHALAKIVGDNYRAADNPDSLTKAITAVFAEVSKTGDGGAADFELLEGLDPALAKDMIGALAKPQNHPIGEKPRLNAQSSNNDPDVEFNSTDSLRTMWLLGGALLFVCLIAGGKAVFGSHH